MAPRPTERKAVAELLMQPAEDVDELAVRVIETLDALRAERPFFVAAVVHEGTPWAYGPVSTTKQAERVLQRIPLTGVEAGVVQVFPLAALEAREAASSEALPGTCARCDHPREAHAWPKSKIRGCVVGEVTRGGRVIREACQCAEFSA